MRMRTGWTVVVALLGLALTGCDPRFKCTSDSQCSAGRVCLRINPSTTDDGSQCVVPCTTWTDGVSAECQAAGLSDQCYCPDSPSGGRCTRYDGTETRGAPSLYCLERK